MSVLPGPGCVLCVCACVWTWLVCVCAHTCVEGQKRAQCVDGGGEAECPQAAPDREPVQLGSACSRSRSRGLGGCPALFRTLAETSGSRRVGPGGLVILPRFLPTRFLSFTFLPTSCRPACQSVCLSACLSSISVSFLLLTPPCMSIIGPSAPWSFPPGVPSLALWSVSPEPRPRARDLTVYRSFPGARTLGLPDRHGTCSPGRAC